jgi:hypothetical protein
MRPYLKLTFGLNLAEHEGSLTATLSSGSFSGRSSLWVDLSLLPRFADELELFPITEERYPQLVAGSCRQDSTLIEDDAFVKISIRPLNAIGALVARAEVAESVYGPNRREEPRLSQAVRVAFPVQYQAVAEFAAALRKLSNGDIKEASLGAASD